MKWLAWLSAVLLLQIGAAPNAAARVPEDPEPNTPIRHVIVLMQENHTFDNYFGTYPGADGFPEGLCVPVNPFDPQSTDCVEPFHIGDQPIQDLDHSRRTYRIQHNQGRMDGFIYALDILNQEGRLALGYYDDRELAYYWNLADEYVLFDRFFSSASAGSFMNHTYWMAASPGRGEDKPTLDGLNGIETIFDRLHERDISWRVYIQKYDPELDYRDLVPGAPRPPQVEWVPLLSMDRFLEDPELSERIVDLDQYYEDLRQGQLPAVSYIKIIGASEHPPGSLLSGQRATRALLQALMQSDAWEHAAFILTYDDWGGWYDHVPPPQVDAYGYGFRVPTLLVSPYARQGYVDHTTLDYTSILKFIEENWDIDPLTDRDARANSLSQAFDFEQPPRQAQLVPMTRYAGEGTSPTRVPLIYASYTASFLFAAGLIARALREARRES